MTDKQAPESRGTEVSDDELCSIIVRACNINAIDVTPAEMQFARDLARALLATQRSTEPAAGWISVKETPIPRDGGSFIVTDGKSVAPHVRGVISNNPGTSWDWQYGEAITHWMPLPNAPGREPEPAVRGDAEALRDAAQALVDRWDTPLWKDVEHTGRFIDRLRAALAQTPEGKDEPCPNP